MSETTAAPAKSKKLIVILAVVALLVVALVAVIATALLTRQSAQLRALRGDQLRKLAQNGMLPLIYAHLFSLQLMREIFAAQVQQGKMPPQMPAPAGEA